MSSPSLGFLAWFLWVHGTVNGTEVMGIIGKAVALRCHYPEKEPPNPETFRVQWGIETEPLCNVDAYVPGEGQTNQCASFSNRTRLSDKLKQGDFTLQLFNISQNDEHTYMCNIQKKIGGMFQHINQTTATLKVAANYSKPVLTGPVQSGTEVTFTCNSSHGYPKPKVYWINQTDHNLLKDVAPPRLTEEPSGTFSVSSTLTIKATSSDVRVGCVIENERLHENLSTPHWLSAEVNSVVATTPPNSSPSPPPATAATAVGSIVFVLLAISLCVWWWHKRKHSLQQKYAAPAEITDFPRPWTTEERSGDVESVP